MHRIEIKNVKKLRKKNKRHGMHRNELELF